MAGLIANGDFEAVTAGKFDSWNYDPSTKQIASPSTTPTVIGGNHSARLLYGSTNGGFLDQTVSTEGLSEFTIELDFAILDIGTPGLRTLGLRSNDDVANACVYYTTSGAELYFYTGSAFVPTSLFASTTTDLGTARSFADNETPVLNHLKLEGKGYGTSNATLTLTLTGGAVNGTYTGTSNPSLVRKLSTFGFFGVYRDAEFLVDNVSARVPEPSALVLLAGGLWGLLACAWRRKRRCWAVGSG